MYHLGQSFLNFYKAVNCFLSLLNLGMLHLFRPLLLQGSHQWLCVQESDLSDLQRRSRGAWRLTEIEPRIRWLCAEAASREASQEEHRRGGDIAHTTGKTVILATQEMTNNKASNKATNGKEVNEALFKQAINNNYILIKGAEEKREQQRNQIRKRINKITTTKRQQEGNQGSKETHAATQAATPPSLDKNGQAKRGKEILVLIQEMNERRARLYGQIHKNINEESMTGRSKKTTKKTKTCTRTWI